MLILLVARAKALTVCASLPHLQPEHPRYPKGKGGAGKNQRAASDRFADAQPRRTDEFRMTILDPIKRRRKPMGCEEPYDDPDGQACYGG